MSQDTKTISAKLETDSALATEFEEFRKQNGMTSKSEAVRHLLRAGLAEQMHDDDRDARDEQTVQTSSRAADWIEGNEPIIFGFAFLIGADGILSSMTAVAGGGGQIMFGVLGLLLAVWIIYDAVSNWRVSDDPATSAAETANGGVDA